MASVRANILATMAKQRSATDIAPEEKATAIPATSAPIGRERIKVLVLIFLVVQNSSAALLMRHSRSAAVAHQWNPQTGVIMQELMKGVTCVVLCFREGGFKAAFADRGQFLRTGIPALLYLVQNNMQYVAVSYLDAPTYAVLYQLKILTTGILSVMMLGKKLSMFQWLALGALTGGVSLVTLSQMRPWSSVGGTNGATPSSFTSMFPGLMAVLVAAMVSGLAGVYFEKILKTSHVTLWARNLQMAVYSVVIGIGGLILGADFSTVRESGFFYGYTLSAWLAVANNAFGGLLIAVVIKYADNIMKNFSQGLSIIFTAITSCIFFNSSVNTLFVLGGSLVIYSILLYGNVMQPLPRVVVSAIQCKCLPSWRDRHRTS